MRSRLHLALSFVAAVVFLAACSSTTLVASDNRPSAAPAIEAAAPSDAGTVDDDAEPAVAEPDESPESADDAVTSDEPAEEESTDPQTPRELEEAEGFGLGGADQLASYVTDCESGNDMACDILFQLSDFDSPEEATALICGGRTQNENIFCTADIDALPEQLVFDTESAGIDQVVLACQEAGDMTACDFLYFRSAIGSELEEVGATCGGRVNVAVPDCRTFLAE